MPRGDIQGIDKNILLNVNVLETSGRPADQNSFDNSGLRAYI